jgi:hypothetical protein
MWNVADRRGCGALWQAAILSRRSIQDDTVIIPLSRGGGEVLESDDLLWCGRPRSLRVQTSPRETCPSRGGGEGGLIWRQGDHEDYVCSRGGVSMLGGDGMGSSTLVPGAYGCMWLRPIMAGFKWHCFSRTHPQCCLPGIGELSGVTAGGLAGSGYNKDLRWVGRL